MSAQPTMQDAPPAGALDGRVVLVTGAAGGLGAAATRACAAAGATVVLLGRKIAKLNRVYDSAAQLGPEPLLYPLDLEGAGPDDYATLAERLEGEVGRLDGLLHCAADFAGLTPFELGDPAAFARAIHVNLTARAWLTQACLPLLRRREDAAVVFALDDPQRVGQAYWGGYGVAQHGLRGLIDTLHHELRNSPVRVSGVQPGPMRTHLRARAYTHENDFAPVEPAAYAEACVQLLSAGGAAWRGQVRDLLA
ncbi:SDR family NAD(P)-dependent oxidoreductase [Stenotrophomonas sp. NLF4-10]|uniref:SDR family NAD(P)-dependent oxidoreductase n=1 Tax=Stenotrophomonas sp. NLF4-10 TaxID=2918754 RepID=UPI001EFBF0FD|nr:SDR family NAD(P)-dependent oxidoreductase [Stenotrophomonas sp. NLF4-10]MCG8276158.1 SDR family NAD(P)-dependent oxidoreductase [Stenotrophomonas sp. NLF4-10]